MSNSPYIGLIPYSDEDAPRFFGRSEERTVIAANLRASRLTLLYGASGVGKSSVLRAGVAFHLDQLSKRNVAERGSPGFIVVYFNSWRENPILPLLQRVHESVAPFLKDQAPQSPLLPANLAQALQLYSESANASLLIILDQFEEYFLYHPEGNGGGEFDEQFARAVNRPDLRTSFLISIREDALAKLDRFKGLIPNILGNYLRIDHLTPEAAREAIERPLEWYNKQPAADNGMASIEPELVKKVLEQVETGHVVLGEAGQGCILKDTDGPSENVRIETPFLQLVMTRLWEEEQRLGSRTLRAGTLKGLGGAKQIVETHLDKSMQALSPSEQETAANIFNFLVTPSGAKIAQTLRDLQDYANVPAASLADLLEKLCDARILRPVESPADRPDDPRYQIFHDVLALAILDWRARFVRRRQFTEAKKRTEEESRRAEEARTAKRMRWGIAALVVALLLALGATVEALTERSRIGKLEISTSLSAAAINNLQQDPELSVLLAMYAVDAAPVQRAMDALYRSLHALRQELTLTGHSDRVIDVSFSPDGRLIASGSFDHTARIWDASTGQLLHKLELANLRVLSACFSYDGTRLATAAYSDSDGGLTLHVWDVATGVKLGEVSTQGGLVAAVCHPAEHVVATAEFDDSLTASTIRIWDTQDAHAKPKDKRHWSVPGQIKGLAFSKRGDLLVTCGADHIVRVWQVETGRQTLELKGHTDQVMGADFSPDNQFLASTGMDRTIRIWNLKGENLRTVPTGHTNTVFKVKYDQAGRLVSASADARVKVWDPLTEHELLNFAGHTGPVEGVSFSPDGRRVASASWDGTIRVWNAESHKDALTGVSFSPSEGLLATGSRDSTVKLWDTTTGRELLTLPPFDGEVNDEEFSRSGRLMAATSNDGNLRIWDVAAKSMLSKRQVGSEVNGVSFSPDDSQVVTGDQAGRVMVWGLKANALPRTLDRHDDSVGPVAYSPDGTLIASVSASADGTARLWNADSGAIVHQLEGHKQNVFGLAFSLDGKLLATSGLDTTVKLWNVASGVELRTIVGHTNAVSGVAFSPDGKSLATASWDRTARIWDVATGNEKQRFTFSTSVNGIEFSSDGKLLAVATDETTPSLYVLDKDMLMRQARDRIGRLGRVLQPKECRGYLHDDKCPPLP